MEDENEGRLDRVKRHLKENKKTYLIGAGCLAAGYFLRRPGTTAIINNVAPNIAPSIAPVFNNVSSFGGHMTKMVKRLSDGKMWETVTEAAAEEGFDLSRFSRHLNGHTEHLNGEIYAIIGIGTTS
jgi:hypothetical protein